MTELLVIHLNIRINYVHYKYLRFKASSYFVIRFYFRHLNVQTSSSNINKKKIKNETSI